MKELILCFGNPYIKEDSLAVEIGKELKKQNYNIKICGSGDEILNIKRKKIFILDVAENIKKATIIKNLDILESKKACSAHDIDLLFFLKLLKEIGKAREIIIIGIPAKGIKKKVIKDIKSLPLNL